VLETKELSVMNEDIDTSKPLPDDYELGSDRLRELAEGFGLGYPDDNLLSDIRHGAAHWQLPAPKWTRIETGSYELKTPCGTLTVQRRLGWLICRDGAPLAWRFSSEPIMFDKLEDAQMSAVLHARDREVGFPDGTWWAQ
jgi:hypothetical protein